MLSVLNEKFVSNRIGLNIITGLTHYKFPDLLKSIYL